MEEYGLSITTNSGIVNIDSEFKALAFLRKEIRQITSKYPHNEKVLTIKHDVNEVVVLSIPEGYSFYCYKHLDNTFQVRFPAEMEGKEIEILYFGFPTKTNKYGMAVYNAQGEMTFSSAYKYLKPIGMASYMYTPALGGSKQKEFQCRLDIKHGVILSCSPAYHSKYSGNPVIVWGYSREENIIQVYEKRLPELGRKLRHSSHSAIYNHNIWVVDITGY